MNPRTLFIVSGAVLFTSCASLNRIPAESGESGGIGNAIVIEDESLDTSRGSSVVSIMQNHVRGMSVSREQACPRIVVRSGRSQAAEAVVYIDGQRLSDTCILDALAIDAISRVEVYPSGITRRPGYHSNNGGLIIVFTKNGSDSPLW